MQFSQIPPDYAPLGAPLRYVFADTAPAHTFDLQVFDYGIGDVVGARRLFDTQAGQIDIAPILRNRLRFQPGTSATGFYDAADRYLIVDVEIEGVRSPVRNFLPRCSQVELPALLTTLPVKRVVVRGGCEELTLVTATACTAVVTAYAGGQSSTRSFTATQPGVVLFRLNTADFPDAERLSVRFDRFAQVSWEVVEARACGCRVAWRSEAGAIEHYDFPVVREERIDCRRSVVRDAGNGRIVAQTEADRVRTLLSAYETRDTLRALAGILHAPQVWVVEPDGGGYTSVEVASTSAGVRRHGSLCNLEVELRNPVSLP